MTDSSSPSFFGIAPDSLTMAVTASSLPLATRLGEFELTGVLGEGGFSVVYAALDHSLDRIVAIKEYMPGAIATRLPDGSVLPKSPRHEETFRAGLTSFLNEGRLLARFTHPALVHIHRIWEQNGTAYMAMQYCIGKTLRQISQSDPAMIKDEGWLKSTFAPVLDALELLHAQHCFHRDISPDNILVLQTGEPILLDFGAARQVIGDMTQALTVILRPGFAPIEQYADDPSLQQGPWTDIYGIGAVIYYLLIGKPPVASVARLVKDPMVRLADSNELSGISRSFREVIDRTLAIYPNQRIQSIADFRQALQLPTFRANWLPRSEIDVTTTDIGLASSNVHSSRIGLGSYARQEDDANSTLPGAEVGAIPSFSFSSGMSIATEVPKSGATTIINTLHQLIKYRNIIFIGGGFFIPMLVAIFWLLHKSTDAAKVYTHNSAIYTPIKKPLKPSSSINSSTLLPIGTQASAPIMIPVAQPSAALQNNMPITPIIKASDALSKKLPEYRINIEDHEIMPLPDKSVAAPNKTQIRTTLPQPIASAPALMASREDKRLLHAEINSTKTRLQQQPKIKNKSAPAMAASQSVPASSGKESFVRLSIKPWGQVAVDGQSQGVSPPLTHLSLVPGDHVITITNGDFSPVTIKITVPEKGSVVVAHQF